MRHLVLYPDSWDERETYEVVFLWHFVCLQEDPWQSHSILIMCLVGEDNIGFLLLRIFFITWYISFVVS